MKAIKILIFTIILILVLGAATVALVYFYTDTFKSSQEIFYKYVSEDQVAKLSLAVFGDGAIPIDDPVFEDSHDKRAQEVHLD